MDDYKALPKIDTENDITGRKEEFIDFEECVRQGIDAIDYESKDYFEGKLLKGNK